MANHTPGPWNIHPSYPLDTPISSCKRAIDPFDFWDARVAQGEKLIAEVSYQSTTAGFPRVTDIDEAKANALLIVAAPEMLEVLKSYVIDDPCAPGDKRLLAAIAVIAKATGVTR